VGVRLPSLTLSLCNMPSINAKVWVTEKFNDEILYHKVILR
jgi:hypothetical protein